MRLSNVRQVTVTLCRCTACGEYAEVHARRGKAPYFSRHAYLPAGLPDTFQNRVHCASQSFDSTDTRDKVATVGTFTF